MRNKHRLFPHQLQAVEEILKRKRCTLCSNLGEGASLVPVEVAERLDVKLCVIAPRSLHAQWADAHKVSPATLRTEGINAIPEGAFVYVDVGITGSKTLEALEAALEKVERYCIRQNGAWGVHSVKQESGS